MNVIMDLNSTQPIHSNHFFFFYFPLLYCFQSFFPFSCRLISCIMLHHVEIYQTVEIPIKILELIIFHDIQRYLCQMNFAYETFNFASTNEFYQFKRLLSLFIILFSLFLLFLLNR